MTQHSVITPATVPRRRLDTRVRNVGGTLVVGRLQHALELSDTARFIWQQIDGVRAVLTIAEMLGQMYDEPDQDAVADDVIELIGLLVEARVVEI
jgi:hypothetical protein